MCIRNGRKRNKAKRKRRKCHVMIQVALGVVSVLLQYSLVGPGVKRLYALDTPQSKNMNILNRTVFQTLQFCSQVLVCMVLAYTSSTCAPRCFQPPILTIILERATKKAMVAAIGTIVSSYIAFCIARYVHLSVGLQRFWHAGVLHSCCKTWRGFGSVRGFPSV
jgi:hypothetical protein